MKLIKAVFVISQILFITIGLNAQTQADFNEGRWIMTFEMPDASYQFPVDISLVDGKLMSVSLAGGLKFDSTDYQNRRLILKGNSRFGRIEIKSEITGYKMKGKWQTGNSEGEMSGEFQPTVNRLKIFDEVWQTVNKEFYSPKFNGVDWNAIGTKYRKEAEKLSNDGQFYQLINKMLDELKSSHIGFYMVGKKDSSKSKPNSGNNNDSANEPKIIDWKKIDNKVGYLKITSFAEGENYVSDIDKAFAEIGDLPFLIVDLRGNEGGTLSIAMRLGDYIYDKPQLLGVFATRHGLDANKVGSITELEIDKLPKYSGYNVEGFLSVIRENGVVALVTGGRGEKQYRGKMVVLIDGNSASASEGFVSAIKETKVATLIGRRTPGAMLSSRNFEITDDWTLKLPEADFSMPKGFRPEIVGILPDIVVKEVKGKDADLEKALEFLKENK